MHPALPSGVHLKALETYDIMFKSMGTNRLAEELFIYGAGMFELYCYIYRHKDYYYAKLTISSYWHKNINGIFMLMFMWV